MHNKYNKPHPDNGVIQELWTFKNSHIPGKIFARHVTRLI